MVANYIIGLREGLEMFIIVSILIAFVVKQEKKYLLKSIISGALMAIFISLILGGVLIFGSYRLTFEAQEILDGTLSVVTAIIITWIALWVAKNSKYFSKNLQYKAGLGNMKPFTLFAISFFSVGREGLETAFFIWSSARLSNNVISPFLFSMLGILTSIILGICLYRGLIKINISKFFQLTCIILIIISAGILSYGIGDLQESGILPGYNTILFDISEFISPDNFLALLVKSIFNLSTTGTLFESLAWIVHITIAFIFYFKYTRKKI